MKNRKHILAQMVRLFIEEPKYRDDRIGTIVRIVEENYSGYYGKDLIRITATFQADIDRLFRKIQEEEPELRGKQWLKRQRQGGNISKAEYLRLSNETSQIKEIYKQLKLDLKWNN